MKTISITGIFSFFLFFQTFAADSSYTKLNLTIPLVDFPQNATLPYHYPSMNQALHWSAGLYDLSFYGIDALGNHLFKPTDFPEQRWRKHAHHLFDYGVSFAFARYGSELPIPLGIWGHEEFHRSALGVNGISAKNGNWLLSRWDGTVYGVSDQQLRDLKLNDPSQLLYAYTAGVQYELALNQNATLNNFYMRQNPGHNAVLLYDAWYIYNYFRFATSPLSDSVKVIAPKYENSDPSERDFAGADLTAWAYDMFNPDLPFTDRDSFPGGEGVNRRVGFSDLSDEAQNYLVHQRNLSWLNVINPSIFGINRIHLQDDLSFSIFSHYAPTHFGNAMGITLPVQYKNLQFHLNAQRYRSHDLSGISVEIGTRELALTPFLKMSGSIAVWQQPKTFFGTEFIRGGMAAIQTDYQFTQKFRVFFSASAKTSGWYLGNPWLTSNFSVSAGMKFSLSEN